MKKTSADINKVYNVKSFEKIATTAKSFKDEGGIILARNLEFVSPEIFTQEFAGLTFLNSGITVNNEGGYATSIQKLKLTVEGGYVESGTASNGTGKITLSGEDDSIPVFSKEAESAWTEVQLKQAELQNINLPSRFFEGHAELYNRDLDSIGYLGQLRADGTQKTTGLLNSSAFATSSAGGAASTLTGAELYAEIAELITAQFTGVLNVETFKATNVIMPVGVFNIAQRTILNSAGSEMSVLAALIANFPTITFGLTSKAATAGASDASVTVAFSNNRRAMQFRLPVPLNVSSVDQRGFKYFVESFFSIAGLDVIETGSARTLTGL